MIMHKCPAFATVLLKSVPLRRERHALPAVRRPEQGRPLPKVCVKVAPAEAAVVPARGPDFIGRELGAVMHGMLEGVHAGEPDL